MLQITQAGSRLSDPELIHRLRHQFLEQQLVKLDSFVESSLLQKIQEYLKTAKFQSLGHFDSKHQEFARDLTIDGKEVVVHLIHLALNSAKLFQAIRQITDCPKIGNFSGRIYRSQPGSNHHLSWHDDIDTGDRLIGISINLGSEKYSGGAFQLRDKRSKRILNEVANTGAGDALIFKISEDLEHRLTDMEGEIDRTACSGWFSSQPDCMSVIKRLYEKGGKL